MQHLFEKYFLPASDDEIQALEKNICYLLPEDYKQFLKTINGGFFSGGYFRSSYVNLMTVMNSFYGLDMNDSFPEEKLCNLKYAHNNMFHNEFPRSQIQIASSVITQAVMSLLPEDHGFIYCGHRELGDEHDYNEDRARRTSNREELSIVGFTLYADSFTHFLENQVSEEEYDADLASRD
jgi:hypothetical protein